MELGVKLVWAALAGGVLYAAYLCLSITRYIRAVAWPSGGPERAADAGRHSARRQRSRPALLLTPTATPGFSKLGGEPDLPAEAAWPTGQHGPLAFIAQLDLPEVRAGGGPDWLPAAGALWFFHDDRRYGFADHLRVLFSPDGAHAPRAAPTELHRRRRFAERRAGFQPTTPIPLLDWQGVGPDEAELSDDALDVQHRIGGEAGELAWRRMAIACEHLARGLPADAKPSAAVRRAARSWRLLLQVDSDPALGMNWGDGGRLYIFVRAQHAKAGKFGKTVALSETY